MVSGRSLIGVVHLNWYGGLRFSVLFLSSFIVGNEAHMFVVVSVAVGIFFFFI